MSDVTNERDAGKACFTPGPWVVGPVDDTVVTHLGADGLRYEIASIDGDYNQPDQWPTMEANARLIAAAPCLLAALERVVATSPIDDDVLPVVLAAIALATGAA